MNATHRSVYREVDQLQEALGHLLDLEITRSKPGSMETGLSATQIDGCLIYESRTTTPLLCTGARSEAFWNVSPITTGCAGGRFRGQTLTQGQVLLLDPGGEVYQQIAAGQSQQVISIPLELVDQTCQAEYGLPGETLWQSWRTRVDDKFTAHLSSLIGSFLSDPGAASRLGLSDGINLAGHIVWLAMGAQQCSTFRSPPRLAQRRRIVGVAEDLMRSRLNNPPSIPELCEATHTSRRLLFYAFEELLGRTPAAHMKILRLHAARRRIALRSNERCVQRIAADLGFGHLGQFAIDYALLFGESPRETGR